MNAKKLLVISMRTNDINEVLAAMLQIPVIENYVATHELINRAITHNDCYSIVYDDIEKVNRGRKTTISVYLNAEMIAR